MTRPLLRHCAAPITGAALVAGTLLIAAPAASAADDPVTTVTSYKAACQANSIIDVTKIQDTSVSVTAPTQVEPGETFTYRIQPGPSSYPNRDSGATTTNVSRLKFDFMIPENSTFVEAAVVGSGTNLDNVPPNVIRVDETGNPAATGQILRLSGNNEVIGNGPSGSVSTNSEGGIRAPKLQLNLDGSPNADGDSWFQLPAVDVTVVAGDAGTPIEPKLRTGGIAANFNALENFNTFLPRASLFGTQWANTRCVPRDSGSAPLNAGAGPLATINVVASQVSTTTTLSAPDTAETGTPVTLTATVAPDDATGSIQFQDGGVDIGSPVTVEGGTASLDYTFTTTGSHSVAAVFTGTGNFADSTSSAQVVSVNDPVDVETTLALTVPQDAETGTLVDLTANVTPSNAEGTVQFKDEGADIGGPVTVAAGTATLSHAFTTAGAHTITAEFTGAPGFAGSTAGAETVTVTDPVDPVVETTTTVSAPANAETGEEVTLTASVAPDHATGTVQFTDGGEDIGSPVTVSNGVATLQHTFSAAGAHNIAAVFTGGTGFGDSTASAQTVTVSDPTPVDADTTTILSVPGNAKTGEPERLYATVYDVATAEVVPSVGAVEFFDGGVSIGTAPVDDGLATLTHTFTTEGAHTITATFTGATGFAGSTAAAKGVEVAVPTPIDIDTATVITVPANATVDSPVELTAQVTGAGDVPVSGTVQFFDGENPIGDAVAVVDGTAVLSHSFTTSDAHVIHAVFSGGQGVKDSTSDSRTIQVSSGGLGSLSFGS
ncbi:Ig-like domain-containing protein [Rhodococcus xishaensis]|uniref:Ig-like domain repeat protein n=1 Tax=Rhodococcus xishaensis TaxID=2487364 RepID=A0A438ATX1_9NOCA|nr:Ig-like domain-containing protein [Rhodococcus xishaensis]RVW02140.1 Ig-like domain repeat protein [Rhodococcus xishaensis]